MGQEIVIDLSKDQGFLDVLEKAKKLSDAKKPMLAYSSEAGGVEVYD